MSYLIGIDGGGTKTRAVAYTRQRDDGIGAAPDAAFEAGACNIAFMALLDAFASVEKAIDGLQIPKNEIMAACAAVAGYSFRTRREQFRSLLQELLPDAKVIVIHDYRAAFRGALPDGRGIMVVSGTGSMAYGADGMGRRHNAGGSGYIIDDSGTGYGVGRAGLAAVMASLDGTGEPTSLTRRIEAELGTSEWDGIIELVYGGAVDRVRIAGLSRCVAAAASEDGDEIAERILMRAGGALARQAEAVYNSVFRNRPSTDSLPVMRAGSLWNAGTALTDVFERSFLRFAPEAAFVRDIPRDPADGAAMIAADSLHS